LLQSRRPKERVLLMAAANSSLPIFQSSNGHSARFAQKLREHGFGELQRLETTTLQINVGKLCNQACHHCHVDAGPKRTEIMPRDVARRTMELLEASPSITTVDITGGAPELNPNFRWLVAESQRLGRHVIDRCNLTVLLGETQGGLGDFLAERRVEIIASLPCYTSENVDKQRGKGVFDKSMEALRRLNGLGYGMPGSGLRLHLVYNPLGPSLPPPQVKLEADYKKQLRENHGIEFHQLLTITNMPIHRFEEDLQRSGKHDAYMDLLLKNFNAATVGNVMCRALVSVGWDGKLYDCDFNQMLDMGIEKPELPTRTIWEIESLSGWAGRKIATAGHCFGCTAGAGSSCGGALS
jgi:radical SAM/Cys-rich protein